MRRNKVDVMLDSRERVASTKSDITMTRVNIGSGEPKYLSLHHKCRKEYDGVLQVPYSLRESICISYCSQKLFELEIHVHH
jgi:hypothetical protein